MQFCFSSMHSITNSFQSAFKPCSMQSAYAALHRRSRALHWKITY